MQSVAVVAFDGISPFHLSVPTLVFGGIGVESAGSLATVRVCTERPGRLATAAGYPIVVDDGLDALTRADTVVMPSWLRDREPPPSLLEALRDAHANGARIVGLCLGSVVVAATGLVDGREIATHWSAARAVAERYPDVVVRHDILWSDLGDVITSAGVAAALDCCLHIVRKDHGAAVATELARAFVLAPHRSGSQAQFIPLPVPEEHGTDPIEQAMVWARSRLGEPVDLDGWADAVHLSRRTFTRRFRERTGSSPQQWLLQQRIDCARVLLETTGHTMDRVAEQAGLGTAVSMRRHFRRALGTSPAAHRAAFTGG